MLILIVVFQCLGVIDLWASRGGGSSASGGGELNCVFTSLKVWVKQNGREMQRDETLQSLYCAHITHVLEIALSFINTLYMNAVRRRINEIIPKLGNPEDEINTQMEEIGRQLYQLVRLKRLIIEALSLNVTDITNSMTDPEDPLLNVVLFWIDFIPRDMMRDIGESFIEYADHIPREGNDDIIENMLILGKNIVSLAQTVKSIMIRIRQLQDIYFGLDEDMARRSDLKNLEKAMAKLREATPPIKPAQKGVPPENRSKTTEHGSNKNNPNTKHPQSYHSTGKK
ncbi:MAG: hypothetical protein LBG20_03035 [Holosporaceae bacterium]|jgi:hypothetical protein|nr:hypothetical protein [Holosporaceae bacterium]